MSFFFIKMMFRNTFSASTRKILQKLPLHLHDSRHFHKVTLKGTISTHLHCLNDNGTGELRGHDWVSFCREVDEFLLFERFYARKLPAHKTSDATLVA